MIQEHIILAVIWLLYCFLHSFLAVEKVKNYLSVTISFLPYRILYNLFAFISLVLLLWFHFKIKIVQLFSNPIAKVGGMVIAAAGLVIMVICIKKYFRQLSGLQDSFTDKLEVSGIHRFVRHPLYAGTFAFVIGLFLIFPFLNNLIAAAIIIIYTLYGIRLEEKKLVKYFGQQYKDYKNKVPSLIPFIKKAR